MMFSRILLAGLAAGWLVMAPAATTAQVPAKVRREAFRSNAERGAFLADFATVYDCVERVARDRGMVVSQNGTGLSWQGRPGTDESFVLVADERECPSLEGRVLGHMVSRVPRKRVNDAASRKVRLDLDTGKLSGPDGVDLVGVRIVSVRLRVTLKRPGAADSCQVELGREFSEEQTRVWINREGKDGQEFSRELMSSLESKLKLAMKLGEAKKKARREERGEKRESDPKPGDPMPTGPGKPKSVGSPG